MATHVQRIVKSGWGKFSRDTSSSSAALIVMVAFLATVTFLFLVQGASSFLVGRLQSAVDISAYLANDALPEDVTQLQDELLKLPEVASIEYVSQEEALERFKEIHQDDQVILSSLDTIGRNPLLASLNIKASDPSQYGAIATFLENGSFTFIQSVDYRERAPVIERLAAISAGVRSGVFLLIFLLGGVAALVAFNTIRLAISNSREEIEVMRLVGASNWFIRGPFMVQGIVVGLFASILVALLLFPLLWLASSRLESFFSGFNLFEYFLSNFFTIFLLQSILGIIVGVLSSTIAIRKYLRV